MKKRIVKAIAGTLSLMILICGCGRQESVGNNNSIEDNTKAGMIDYETSSLGIDSGSKNFEENLVDGTFYVVHEGIYYPQYTYLKNETAEDELTTRVNDKRMSFFTIENLVDVPTLFPGDHLVYYSTSELLDYVSWERYKDLGPTFGLRDLTKTTAGKYFVDLTKDEEPIIPDSELYDMYNLDVDKVLVDKVGGVVVDDTVVQDGIIVGITKGKTYDMEVYTGTYYKHYNAVANVEAMKSYELFASIGIDTLQDCFWEIDIPDYFVNGYYDINGNGMIRIITEPYYSEETDYNVQLLFPDPDTTYGHENDYVPPSQYSEFPDLNYFSQNTSEDCLGYINPEEEEQEEESEEMTLPDAAQFKEANSKEYELWFPEGKQCSINIRSGSGETTGQAVVSFDTGATASLTYNRFDQVYELTINGKGNKGKINISGFWFDYEIELKNVEIYSGQDIQNEAVDSDMDSPVKEETTSTESEHASEE